MAERRNIINFYVRRPKKSRQKEDDEDRLSSLPDEIITNILSRLSINSAAATSVLSRRWRHLWTTVHRLEFWLPSSTATTILDHIFSQLTSPKLTQVEIDLLQLYPLPNPNPNTIKSWFSDICRRNVEHICIKAWHDQDGDDNNCYEDDDFDVPSFLLSAQSLVSLSLYGQLYFECSISKDVQINLPNLKKLNLDKLVFCSPDWLGKLIKSCPLLEHLDLDLQHFEMSPNIDFSVEIFVPNLKSLGMKVKYPSDDTPRLKFYINAPQLENLYICDCLSLYYLDQHPPKLASACVDLALHSEANMSRLAGDEDYVRGMSKFVRGLSSVRTLNLTVDGGSNIFVDFHSMDDEALPIFCNLIRAELTLENIDSNHWTKLLLFLQCFPELKHLLVDLDGDESVDILPRLRQKCCAPDFLPICLSSQLTTIKISGFIMTAAELEFLGYILSCALVLKKLDIVAYRINDVRKEYHFCWSLFNLPRSSSTCEITFSSYSFTASSADNVNDGRYRCITCQLHP